MRLIGRQADTPRSPPDRLAPRKGLKPAFPDSIPQLLKRFVKHAGIRPKLTKRVGWHILRNTVQVSTQAVSEQKLETARAIQ